jgi:chorismate mutase
MDYAILPLQFKEIGEAREESDGILEYTSLQENWVLRRLKWKHKNPSVNPIYTRIRKHIELNVSQQNSMMMSIKPINFRSVMRV